MKLCDLYTENSYSDYKKEIYYLMVAKFEDEKKIEEIDFCENEIKYLLDYIKNIYKTPRLDDDIEGFIKMMNYIFTLPKYNIRLSNCDIEDTMHGLSLYYNKHFDMKCDLLAFIKGYFYNKGNLNGISNLIGNLYKDYLEKVEKDKQYLLDETKDYNKRYQKRLLDLYLNKCYPVKNIIDSLPSKEIVNSDYEVLGEEIAVPMCVTLLENYLSGDTKLDGYSEYLGKYTFRDCNPIPVPYTKTQFLNSINNKQKLLHN